MAVLLLTKPWFNNQYFGQWMYIADLIKGIAPAGLFSHSNSAWRTVPISSNQDAGSNITMNKDGFHVSLDVQHFTAEEISLIVAGNDIIVEGKQEEKQVDHGTISRHFIGKYQLPEEYSPDDVVSSLLSNGQLVITAARKQIPENQERVVPINLVEKPNAPQEEEEKKSA